MPIKNQFMQYFESGTVFNDTIHHMEKLEQDNVISNVINGSLWKATKTHFQDAKVIPFFLFSDEAEMNDAIGAHSGTHKVWGIYYQFPVIPPQYLGRLENIFAAGFIKASDMSQQGPSEALKDLIDILIDLEQNGIELQVAEELVTVHFVLAGILGDNLGMNTLMGFSSSFSALLYCRFCKMNKYDAQERVQLDTKLTRTKENYMEDLTKPFQESGIKELSAFNRLKFYHVAENFVVDPMHDLYSHGICCYDLALVLRYMIQNLKISLQTINYRIQMFDYGDTEKRNMFRNITRENIKSASFKMTAREMQLFVHYFPLLFGDLFPQNNDVWDFVMSLVELTDLVLLPTFDSDILDTLEKQIVYHHTLYKTLFKEKFKPKYHILIHYTESIRAVGPPRFTWSFRFEAFHQVFKRYCRNITSRKNVCLTLCTKANLIFFENLNNCRYFSDELEFKNPISIKLIDMPYFPFLDLSSAFMTSTLRAVSKIKFRGVEYRKAHFLTHCSIKMRNLQLYEVLDILITTNEEILFICREWEVLKYSNHYVSFVVGNPLDSFCAKTVGYFDGPPIHKYTVGENTFIRLKKYYM